MKLCCVEKEILGNMRIRCCLLHPDCKQRAVCDQLAEKLDIQNHGYVEISAAEFDKAKQKWLESWKKEVGEEGVDDGS